MVKDVISVGLPIEVSNHLRREAHLRGASNPGTRYSVVELVREAIATMYPELRHLLVKEPEPKVESKVESTAGDAL